MPELPWVFEPCENEGPIRDPNGIPWSHAVRGRKPARPMVIGYGHTESAADYDARDKAQQQDAHEVLGERGEVVTTEGNGISHETRSIVHQRLLSADERSALFNDGIGISYSFDTHLVHRRATTNDKSDL